jgi:hypothetical protein
MARLVFPARPAVGQPYLFLTQPTDQLGVPGTSPALISHPTARSTQARSSWHSVSARACERAMAQFVTSTAVAFP